MATGRADDLLWQVLKAARAGSVYLNLDLRSLDEEVRSPLYQLLAKPWGLLYFMSGVALNSPEASAYVTLGRTSDASCFNTLERHLLGGGLLGHLGRGVVLHRGFAAAASRAALYSSVLDAMPDGVVVFNAAGHAVVTNRAAEQIFGTTDALRLNGGRIETRDRRRQALLDQALQSALAGTGTAPPAAVYVASPAAPAAMFRVVFSSLPVGQGGDGSLAAALPAEAAALAVICTTTAQQRSTLVARYGLTPAEERLCLLLIGGRSLQEAADALAIKRNTVKTHLSRIFDKAGVRSQAGLIGLLAPILNKR